MSLTDRPRVLCVDDEPNVLEGLSRTLRRDFDVVTAVGSAEGVEALQQDDSFAVVVSDLHMPGTSGIVFLTWVREIVPDAVRILLTGNADVTKAIEAVNEGRIFRYLQKPCPSDVLIPTIAGAVEQYRLVTSERVLLEQTLHGSITLLTDLLALVHPAAFGRASRAKQRISELCTALKSSEHWQTELAALLSQIGVITLAPELVNRIHAGKTLSDSERATVERLPDVADRLLAHIPRLEPVREILRYQNSGFTVVGQGPAAPAGATIPQGARMLRVVLDFDHLEASGIAAAAALDALSHREGQYDPAVVSAFRKILGAGDSATELRELALSDLRVGMFFAADVTNARGVLLVARGQEVTHALVDRIENYWQSMTIAQPIPMLVPLTHAAAASAA